MNAQIIAFQKFVDKNNVNIDQDNWILLDSIEIYQIHFPNQKGFIYFIKFNNKNSGL